MSAPLKGLKSTHAEYRCLFCRWILCTNTSWSTSNTTSIQQDLLPVTVVMARESTHHGIIACYHWNPLQSCLIPYELDPVWTGSLMSSSPQTLLPSLSHASTWHGALAVTASTCQSEYATSSCLSLAYPVICSSLVYHVVCSSLGYPVVCSSSVYPVLTCLVDQTWKMSHKHNKKDQVAYSYIKIFLKGKKSITKPFVWSKQLWCFTPSQPVWLYQGEPFVWTSSKTPRITYSVDPHANILQGVQNHN